MVSCAHEHSHKLEVRDIHAHYGKRCVLHNVSFELQCGNCVALMGPNGAGKTTLLKSLVGLIPSVTGSILWQGKPIHKNSFEIAFLPQQETMDWSFPITVQELVETGRYPRLGWYRKMDTHDYEAVQKAMTAMDVLKFAERQIGALSMGQRQRVLIARTLAQEPHVLLLDEPFTGLDEPSANILARQLKAFSQHGTLVLASHHNIQNAAEIFNEVLFLDGKLRAQGRPEEVLEPKLLQELYGSWIG